MQLESGAKWEHALASFPVYGTIVATQLLQLTITAILRVIAF